MSKVKKYLKVFLGLPLTFAAFFFIGKILTDSLPQISSHIEQANIVLLLMGMVFMLLFFLTRSIAWAKILSFFGETEKGIFHSIYSYSAAETKRYVPGSIFSFISRVQKFENSSLSKGTIVKALILESGVMVISAFTISLPAAFGIIRLNNLFLIAVIAFALVLLSATFRKYQRFFLSFLPKRKFIEYVDVIFLSSIAWLLFGLGNYFFLVSIFPSDPNLIFKLASCFVLAWIIGYLAFVAPMGLGVREAAVIFLLEPFLPSYAAAAVAVITRILFVLSEVIFLALSFAIHKFNSLEKLTLKRVPLIIVSMMAFSYAIYFSFVSIVRHYKFYSGKFDLGNMENTLWNTLHGNFFVFSNPDGANELSRLSAHADFILLAFVPIYALFPTVNTLLVAQTLVLAAGGIFVYLIAREILKSDKLSILLSFGYYLNFFVQEQNIFDFHSVSLATTFLLAAFYFIYKKRYWYGLVFLTLSVLTKENVYLVTAVFGGYLYINGKRFFGAGIFAFSLVAFFILMTILIPGARSGEHFALEYLAYLGNSPLEILLSPILRPEAFFGRIFSLETFEYLKKAFMPVGYLSFLAPHYLIFVLPELMINILSDNPNLRSIQYHYGAVLVPFIYISAIFGLKKMRTKISESILFYVLLGFVIYSFWLFSPFPGTRNSDTEIFKNIPHDAEILAALKIIPNDASVSSSNSMAAHLVQREKIYVLPSGIDTVDFLVFYKTDIDLAYELIGNDNFAVIFNNYGLIILKRTTPHVRDYKP